MAQDLAPQVPPHYVRVTSVSGRGAQGSNLPHQWGAKGIGGKSGNHRWGVPLEKAGPWCGLKDECGKVVNMGNPTDLLL